MNLGAVPFAAGGLVFVVFARRVVQVARRMWGKPAEEPWSLYWRIRVQVVRLAGIAILVLSLANLFAS